MNKKLVKAREARALKNEFAKQCFRDIADYDYIGARILFRNKCFDQFLHLAHQCIEKYLKAILLFNNVEHPRPEHDLEVVLSKVKKGIKIVCLEKETEDFIKGINTTRHARYLSAPFSARKSYLIDLDKAVWDLRLFCQSKEYQRLIVEASKDKDNFITRSIKGRSIIQFGILEKVIENKSGKLGILRENLVWKNFRFGKKRKQKIKFGSGRWGKSPIFFHGDKNQMKEAFEVLREYVHFPKEVKNYFES